MRAVVNRDVCTGCELCVATCPEVFGMGDDSIARVTVDTVPPQAAESCREAALNCPVEAITVR